MTDPFKVSKQAVRQFLLEQQQLTSGQAKKAKPDDVFRTVKQLECVQLDPVAAVARNQHLVLGARMPRYQPDTLEQLLEQRRVFEYWANAACVIPMEDYAMFEPTRRRIESHLQSRLEALGSVVNDVLKRLEAEGPLPAKAFESNTRVHGYWDGEQPKTKATSHALNLLNDMGRIHVVRREGTTRFFDIRERSVPQDLLDKAAQISTADAHAAMLDKYMRAYRVFDAGDARFGWQRTTAVERRQTLSRLVEEDRVVPLAIEGVKRPYFILAEDMEALMALESSSKQNSSTGSVGVKFLPPLDNLLWRRERLEDLFDFSYTWEVYIPATKRQYGYYAMPILVNDQMIGRIDPRLDRERGRLNLELLQINPEVRWTKPLRNRVFHALDEFAQFHHAEFGDIKRTQPETLT